MPLNRVKWRHRRPLQHGKNCGEPRAWGGRRRKFRGSAAL